MLKIATNERKSSAKKMKKEIRYVNIEHVDCNQKQQKWYNVNAIKNNNHQDAGNNETSFTHTHTKRNNNWRKIIIIKKERYKSTLRNKENACYVLYKEVSIWEIVAIACNQMKYSFYFFLFLFFLVFFFSIFEWESEVELVASTTYILKRLKNCYF